jgi:hypothetical protein
MAGPLPTACRDLREDMCGSDVLELLMERGYILQDVIDIIKVMAGLL